MSGKEEILIVEGLTKSFDHETILEDISFRMREGEGFGILGKSGSGKTVLMHAIRGIKEYKPTKGAVIYRVAMCPNEMCGWAEPPSKKGEECPKCGATLDLEEIDYWAIHGTPKFKNLYNRLSLMFQRTFAIYAEKAVVGNIEEALIDINYPKELRMKKIMELVRRVKLTHRSLHVARDLSGGEKQRVVLARQLAKDPVVLFADEPTGTLDPVTAEAVHDVLRQEVENGLTLLMTSHWLEAVTRLTDYGIVIEDGHIVASGKSSDLEREMKGGLEEFKRPEVIEENPIIRVENCRKIFYLADRGTIRAVDGVSFTVNEREIFGIVGVSGAGKTTLGRMIGGLQEPSSGKVCVRIGDEWIDMSIVGPAGRGRATPYISILHQEYGLYPHSTIVQNLTDSIGLTMPAEIAKAKAALVLKAVGFSESKIEEIMDLYPDSLGEGERHRIALARAMMTEPDILILDEPTGTIDPLTLNDIAKAILTSREELGQTYVIMSHDPAFVETVCDRAMLMRGGKIVKIGEPKEVIALFKELEKPMGT
ncbi:MAG: methyl coenzyme M reductase system, component A2 [Candidatus Syntropharchaeia archaeon]